MGRARTGTRPDPVFQMKLLGGTQKARAPIVPPPFHLISTWAFKSQLSI